MMVKLTKSLTEETHALKHTVTAITSLDMMPDEMTKQEWHAAVKEKVAVALVSFFWRVLLGAHRLA